jgi:ABC-type Mn2+/Zn2+ transport system permease subunit
MNEETNSTGQSTGDAAALAGAALAAVFAVFLQVGPYDALEFILGLTLSVILIAYQRKIRRDSWQSLAMSMTFGFCVLLIAAPLLEWSIRPSETCQVVYAETDDSCVTTLNLVTIWFAAVIVTFAVDKLLLQPRIESLR